MGTCTDLPPSHPRTFALAVPSAWRALSPDRTPVCSLISLRCLLRHYLRRQSSPTPASKRAALSLCHSRSSSPSLTFFVALAPADIFFFFFNIYLFIYLFLAVFVGSLCEGSPQLLRAGATLHRSARASHYRGLSCCGAQAPDAQAQ